MARRTLAAQVQAAAEELRAKVFIELEVPTKNISDFIGQWPDYKERLIEFSWVTEARIELPPEGPRVIGLET